MLELVDSIVFIGATLTSITLSITGNGLIILPISAGIACTIILGNKVLHKINIRRYNNYRNKMKKTNKQLNLWITYTEFLYKII